MVGMWRGQWGLELKKQKTQSNHLVKWERDKESRYGKCFEGGDCVGEDDWEDMRKQSKAKQNKTKAEQSQTSLCPYPNSVIHFRVLPPPPCQSKVIAKYESNHAADDQNAHASKMLPCLNGLIGIFPSYPQFLLLSFIATGRRHKFIDSHFSVFFLKKKLI